MGITRAEQLWSFAATRDSEKKKAAVVQIRWVLVITACCVILFSGDKGNSLPSHLVVLGLIFSNILLSNLPQSFFARRGFDSALVSIDTVIISIGLWFTGHANGDFYLLYFLIIMIAALGETLRSILWSAILVTIVYLGLTASTGGSRAVLESSFLLRIPFFFIVAIFYGYFTQMVRAERTARVTFESKWTLAKQLREVSAKVAASLDREEILNMLVRAEAELSDSGYVAVIARGRREILASFEDLTKIPSGLGTVPPAVDEICQSLDRRIAAWQRGREQLEGADMSPEPNVQKGILAAGGIVSFQEGKHTLMPLSPSVESDIYLLVCGVMDEELLEYTAVLLLNVRMALNNAGQYHALVHEAEKRQEVVRQLGDVVEFKSQFLANMTHEMRTPLHSFIGFGELLVGGAYGKLEVDQEAIVSRMLRNARSLLELINNILDLSKLDAGAMNVRTSPGTLEDFLEEVLLTCEPLVRDKPVSLNVHNGQPGIRLLVDWGMLRQIALNLVSNAIKFTAKGRIDVRLTYYTDPERLCLLVRDTGVGIENGKLEEIFQPFRQLENSYTKKYAGTGLGLAISKRQAELMGGVLNVQSKPGSWSEFTLEVPCAAVSAESERTGVAAPSLIIEKITPTEDEISSKS